MDPNYKSILISSKNDENIKTELLHIDNIKTYLETVKLPFTLAKTEDLIHNVYEGGFKIWECTLDVLDYLQENSKIFDLKEKSILDLGCGQGLLGIYALKMDAKSVLFQDYNAEVLQFFTNMNLQANFKNMKEINNKIRFISGDWTPFIAKVGDDSNELFLNNGVENAKIEYDREFDLIFMSEVIYKVENYSKIADILEKLLKKKGGVCVLGTKFYYFGVGGSLPEFEDYITKNRPNLRIIEKIEINNKKANKRAIVLINRI